MKIQEIYTQYNIMPSLQLHMLRVAAVAKIICNSIQKEVDTENVIAACLLHDMGNILKFNMNMFPEFLEPEGKKYWQKVKDEFTEKYGKDEHQATISIAKEIHMSHRIIELIDCFHFLYAQQNEKTEDFGIKIAAYSDMRVEPHHIVSLQGRLQEGRQRFYQTKPELFEKTVFQDMSASLQKIEDQIFTYTSIKTTDITDKSINPLVEDLRKFELKNSK